MDYLIVFHGMYLKVVGSLRLFMDNQSASCQTSGFYCDGLIQTSIVSINLYYLLSITTSFLRRCYEATKQQI